MSMFKSISKKGQLGSTATNATIATFFGLFFIGILVFAYALIGDSMLDVADDGNTSTTSVAENTINKTIVGVEDYANFSPALWIIAGIGLLISILVGSVGVYFLGGRQ